MNRDNQKGIVILIVDDRTQISKKLQEEIDKGKIKLEKKNLNKKKIRL
ncbi:hypothetical protein HMPREF1551_01811 [Capnocytophaga sp. oral taxon 863 str. F0517]|nr:hypothetical protein HMPREF1551_01811 [Capnocytophaga sp. oral taxon 863 str. F0517]